PKKCASSTPPQSSPTAGGMASYRRLPTAAVLTAQDTSALNSFPYHQLHLTTPSPFCPTTTSIILTLAFLLVFVLIFYNTTFNYANMIIMIPVRSPRSGVYDTRVAS
ncbi:hypothetical protein J6590_032589, partial [Homalodisca vitripennis]